MIQSRLAVAAIAAVTASTVAGCATIMDGSTQSMSINSTPSGAAVIKDGAQVGTTPLTLTLKRKETPNFVLRQSGFEDRAFTPAKKVNGWVFGNILLGGLIGLAVDGINGNIQEFEEENLYFTLNPMSTALAQASQSKPAASGNAIMQFVAENSEALMAEMANGQGETLSRLYGVLGVAYGQEADALATLRRQYAASSSDADFANRVALAFAQSQPPAPPAPGQLQQAAPAQSEASDPGASRPKTGHPTLRR